MVILRCYVVYWRIMENKNNNLVPVAIVIAGLIIGAAIYLRTPTPATGPSNAAAVAVTQGDLTKLTPITPEDNIQGNPDAQVKIIEYSDLECPFCKAFHLAMNDLMAKYEKDGKVAWIYRHFPLDRHPQATPEAVAAECVKKLSDNSKFWQYIDKIFEVTPSNNGLDLTLLPKFATELGVDTTKFQSCLDNNETKSIVDANYKNGVEIGVDGTPYAVMILPDGNKLRLFREEPPTNLDADTKAIINDLSAFYQTQIQKLSQAQ